MIRSMVNVLWAKLALRVFLWRGRILPLSALTPSEVFMSNTKTAKVASAATIKRCIRAARQEGFEVSGFEALADGSVRVLTAQKYSADPFLEWEKKHDAL